MTFVVGDYRATELISSGGAAQVWRGVTVDTGAAVAIKVFPPDQLEAARREAALAAVVDHPHVVAVVDVVGDTERAALITAFAAGGDLGDLLVRRGRLSAGETLTVLLPLATVVAAAHEHDVTHGDISARNVVFDRTGRPLLAALGATQAQSESGHPVATSPVDAAPELARGGPPTPATDMFALGSVALACLTGRHAWPADDLRDVLIQAAAGQWPDPGDDMGPPALLAAVRALLEHDPDRRPSAASLVRDLRSAGRPEPLVLSAAAAPRDAVGGDAGSGGNRPVGSQPAGPRPADLRSAAGARPRPATASMPPGRPRIGRVAAALISSTRAARPPGRAVRFGLVAVTCIMVAAMAVAAGLWWASWDRSAPVADPGSPAVAFSDGPLVVSSSDTARRGPTGQVSTTAAASTSSGGRAIPSFSPGARSPASETAAPRAATRSSSPPALPARRGPGPTRAAASPSPPPAPIRSAPVAVAVASSSSATGPDWLGIVHSLDEARARAFVARRVALLDAVYTFDSPARTADARAIAALLSGGLRVSGASHLVRAAHVIGAAPVRVSVSDSLSSYSVLDNSGAVIGRTRSRATATRVLVLVGTSAGYRISTVESA